MGFQKQRYGRVAAMCKNQSGELRKPKSGKRLHDKVCQEKVGHRNSRSRSGHGVIISDPPNNNIYYKNI